MKVRSTRYCGFLIAALLLVTARGLHAESVNQLVDNSFDSGIPSEQGGWTLFDEGRFSTDQARTGSQSMFHWGYSRGVPYPPFLLGSVSGSFQEFEAKPGSRWRLTGYGLTPRKLLRAPAFGVVQISYFDSEGNDLGTIETAEYDKPRAKTSHEINANSPAGEWVFLDTGITTAPERTAAVQAFTLYVDYSGSNTPQGVYFDDLSLCQVKPGDDNGSACE